MKHVFTLVALALMSSGLAQLADYVPSDGLVAWYSLDGLAHDAGTYELDGVLEGPAGAEDRYGNPNGALSFDGVDDRVSIPHSDLTNPSVLTLSVWFKDSDFSNSDGQQSQLISKREFTGWGNAYEFGIGYPITEFPETPTIYSNFSVNGNHTIFHASESIFENQWHQAVYCHGEDSLFIYLDGERVLAQISPGPLPTSNELPTWFGGRPGGSGRHFFSGLLDDIGIWNRVLSHEEILALYISEQPISGCTDTAACNYEQTATEDDGSCDHSCCPGPGCCDVGMHWDWDLGMCQITNVADTNLDGCVQLNDLLDVLSAYGNCTEAEVAEHPCSEGAFFPGDDLACAGWNYLGAYDGGEYYVSSFPLAWDSAQAFAAELNGGLAVISSQEENDWISDLAGDNYVWIGLYQDMSSPEYSEPDGGWLWVDDSPFVYENWDTNAPNNVNNGTEHHCQMYSNGLWNDAPGDLFINGSDGRDIYAVIEFR